MDEAISTETISVETSEQGEEVTAPDAGPLERSEVELDGVALLREFALRSYADLVPDLVTGDTVADLLASVAVARAAYQHVAATISGPPAPQAPIAPAVPAGDAVPFAIDPDRLPPSELIRRGLNHRERRS